MFLPAERLKDYRAETFGLHRRVTSKEEAIAFAEARGFIFFWPIREALLPSLWVAVAGDRPVADEHDDPGHISWGWKDELLGQRRWYYAKVLRKKATMIALAAAPYFYALSDNYGSPADDYLIAYEQGRLTQEAKALYEALLDEGPLDTLALRRAARLNSMESEGRFNKALTELQADFKVLPVAVTQAGAWHYAYAYDITPRHFPELPEAARFIGELDARQKLANLYLQAVGAAQGRDLSKLFGWSTAEVTQTAERLVKAGLAQTEIEIEGQPGKWLVTQELAPH
jgi:tetratricopeptide (TPR) repeat protein